MKSAKVVPLLSLHELSAKNYLEHFSHIHLKKKPETDRFPFGPLGFKTIQIHLLLAAYYPGIMSQKLTADNQGIDLLQKAE